MAEVVQVSRLLDQRGLSSFHYNLIFWCVLLSLIDGYDIAAIAFAAPHLVREWGLKPGQLGPVFSASLVGILFGSALFGWIGDRYGRKIALISANMLFGVFTFAAAYSTNLEQLFWLRLLAGLGIGGVIPNIVAINTESAPRKYRATLALDRRRFRAARRRHSRRRRRHFGADAWLADPVHDRRHRADRPCADRAVHACRNRSSTWRCTKASARKMEKTIAALDPGFKVPANAHIRHRGRAAIPRLQSGLPFPAGAVADHAAAVAALCPQPDGLLLPAVMDADLDGGAEVAAVGWRARRRHDPGRRHGRRACCWRAGSSAAGFSPSRLSS